jgi:hypothetical protein
MQSTVDRLNSRIGHARLALVAAMSRTQCIALLSWNDRGNGCYSDADNAAEGHPPLTMLELHTLVLSTVCDEFSGLASPDLNPDGVPADDDTYLCSQCNGSGEGYADGSRCSACRGSGESRMTDDGEDAYDAYRESLDR